MGNKNCGRKHEARNDWAEKTLADGNRRHLSRMLQARRSMNPRSFFPSFNYLFTLANGLNTQKLPNIALSLLPSALRLLAYRLQSAYCVIERDAEANQAARRSTT